MKKIAIVFVLAIAGLGVTNLPVHASSEESGCHDVDVIFARGSGQHLNQDEAKRFFEQLDMRLPKSAIDKNIYELGTEPYGNYKYPAVPVTEWWKNGNAIGAGLSAGMGNDYGHSVDAGVTELQSYLKQRHAHCPNARIILGGYSQGAQVVGQALPELSNDIQSKIAFVALFGDPKLYLPEGEGVNPPACQGLDFSAWRRVIGDCDTDNGSLGARKPYLPDSMKDKVGLWCNTEDFVCGSSKNVFKNDGHGKYGGVGGAIDRAASEIARRLKLALPPQKALAINDTAIGETETDIVFLLNCSNWPTWREYGRARETIERAARSLHDKKQNVYFGFWEYTGSINGTSAYGPVVFHNNFVPNNYSAFLGAVARPSIPCKSSSVLQPTQRALWDTLNESEWVTGASKSVVVFTNADFFNPDGNITPASLARRSIEIDPVNVFAVVPDPLREKYKKLTDATSGGVVTMKDDFYETADDLVETMTERPVALLKSTGYAADFNGKVTFDASDSYLKGGIITKYEWDLDGDGVFEQATATPRASHTYPAEMRTYYAQVRVTGSNGAVANTSVPVKVDKTPLFTIPDTPTNVAATVVSTEKRKSTVDLSWDVPVLPPCGGSCSYSKVPVASWVVSMNGTVLGRLDESKRSIKITDIDRNRDAELGVAILSPDGVLHEMTSVVIEKLLLVGSQLPTLKSSHDQIASIFGLKEARKEALLPKTPGEQRDNESIRAGTSVNATTSSREDSDTLRDTLPRTQVLGTSTGNHVAQQRSDRPDDIKGIWLVVILSVVGVAIGAVIVARGRATFAKE